MGWPVSTDYFEAVQNPRTSFDDRELMSSTPTLDRLGLPKAISGAFACVYQMNVGNTRWAVRCFLKDFADQQRRYDAISRHLQQVAIPYTVRFEYIQKGIRVRGEWYPILKMEWIDGEPLHSYIERHLHQPQSLRTLARQWKDMVSSLSRFQIAHGDLQHGNVIVSNSQLRLIDYDGMYVPTLAGIGSHEEGHRNYQHPSRTGHFFEPSLDNFSAWIIFISLTALAIEPGLWKQFNGGDEALLFRRDDFERPAHSSAIRLLAQHPKHELRALAAQLKSLLSLPLRGIPGLDGATFANTPFSPSPPTTRTSGSVLPDWVVQHVQPTASPPVAAASDSLYREAMPTVIVKSADWILHQIIDQQPPIVPEQTHSHLLERLLLSFCVLIVIGAVVTLFLADFVVFLLSAGAAISSFITVLYVLVQRHGVSHQVIRKASLSRLIDVETSAISLLEATLSSLTDERKRLDTPLRILDTKYRGFAKLLAETLDTASICYSNAMAQIQRERQSADSEETQKLSAVRYQWDQENRHLRSQLDALPKAELAAVTALREEIRDRHVRWHLENAKVARASLHGIGGSLKARLYQAGVISAADVDSRIRRVSGIGPAKGAELKRWRDEIRNRALANAPGPSPAELQAITSRFANECKTLQNHIRAADTRCTTECDAIKADYRDKRARLDERARYVKRVYDDQVQTAHAVNERRKRETRAEFQQLDHSLASTKQDVDKRITDIQQSIFQKQLEMCKLSRELEMYRDITFIRYIKRIVGLRT